MSIVGSEPERLGELVQHGAFQEFPVLSRSPVSGFFRFVFVIFAHGLVRTFLCRNGVFAAEPAAEVDIGAAR
jgi:hypothetical protein